VVIDYAITNDFLKARNLVEKQISFALLNGNEIDRFKFFLSFGLLLTKIKQNGKTKLKLKLPENLNISNSSNEYLIEDLLNFADSKVKEYASAFDKRNANNYYTQEIETFYNKYLTLKV
jgi:hypothetical protein